MATIPVIKAFKDLESDLSKTHRIGPWPELEQRAVLCSGRICQLLGDDDVLYPECLGRQVEALECPANARAWLAICNRNVITGRNEVVMRRRFPFGPGLVSGRKLIRNSIRWGSNLIGEAGRRFIRRRELKSAMCDPSNPYVIDSRFGGVLNTAIAFVDPDYLGVFAFRERRPVQGLAGGRRLTFVTSFGPCGETLFIASAFSTSCPVRPVRPMVPVEKPVHLLPLGMLVSIIIPCFNEEKVLESAYQRISAVLGKASICFSHAF